MLERVKEAVLKANLELKDRGLIIYTWGNASEIDRERGLVVIKPSGVPYDELSREKMVVVDLQGEVIEGDYRPSSDTETHLELYRNFKEIGGIVHTHSAWATAWSQAGRGIPCLGTTHADYFYGEIPCTREMKAEEIKDNYERNTGRVIVEEFENRDPGSMPAVLVNNHGPFVWGEDAAAAVRNSVILEEIAKMAHRTLNLDIEKGAIARALLDKHFLRKHGEDAYYGQNN